MQLLRGLADLGENEVDIDPAGGQHCNRQQPEGELQSLLATQDDCADDGEEEG